MEEERVKSAFEIAMERISALPELTPEEIAEQNEKRYGPIGEALAGKFLGRLIDDDEMLAEMAKYTAEQGKIVRRSLILSLCRSMSSGEPPDRAAKASAGLIRLSPGKRAFIERAAAEIQSFAREFEEARRKKSVDFATSFLRPLGITGTAIRVNPAENPQWEEELRRLRQEYEPKLERLRSALQKEVQA